MIQEYLGDGAYITVNRDFIGQIIITANHHDEAKATDKVHLDYAGLQTALMVYDRDIQENHI